MIDTILETTKQLVLKCGTTLRTSTIDELAYKGEISDIVTNLDREIEAYLIEQLHQRYPSHHFLGEESLKQDGEYVWIIDPIDGTTNFVSSHRDFAISVALYHFQKPVFGIVYDVMRDEMFVGVHQKGAYCNEEKMVAVYPKTREESILDISLHTMSTLTKKHQVDCMELHALFRGHRSSGCASLNICHIAQGALDSYVSAHVKVWDYAAACIILQEVSGHFQIEKDFFTVHSTFAIFTNNVEQLSFLEHKLCGLACA